MAVKFPIAPSQDLGDCAATASIQNEGSSSEDSLSVGVGVGEKCSSKNTYGEDMSDSSVQQARDSDMELSSHSIGELHLS
mmetsp:Transcript_7088/g.11183  ORF Transcript_7088/g.11183 Transcript_7088/m.11183 type:complete len:80 (+) Transcript_7088:385-624(+)